MQILFIGCLKGLGVFEQFFHKGIVLCFQLGQRARWGLAGVKGNALIFLCPVACCFKQINGICSSAAVWVWCPIKKVWLWIILGIRPTSGKVCPPFCDFLRRWGLSRKCESMFSTIPSQLFSKSNALCKDRFYILAATLIKRIFFP